MVQLDDKIHKNWYSTNIDETTVVRLVRDAYIIDDHRTTQGGARHHGALASDGEAMIHREDERTRALSLREVSIVTQNGY